MKAIAVLFPLLFISGCQTLPPVQCTATASIGGQDTTVLIYGVRKQANQTQYYAGKPLRVEVGIKKQLHAVYVRKISNKPIIKNPAIEPVFYYPEIAMSAGTIALTITQPQ